MKHKTLPRFWALYRQLPDEVKKLADRNYQLLRLTPTHPSLHFKKVGKNRQLWSVRIGKGYRALGVEKPDAIYWFWIGTHAEYDRLAST